MTEELRLEVFISWSGLRAGAVANELKSWLEVTFQFTRPFLSKDIGAGKRWSQDLAEALERSNFGVLVLTPESMDSQWLLFEAGALAKHLGSSRVVPLLIDLEVSDLRLPLSDFQAVRLWDQLFDLASALNDAQPDPWSDSSLRKTFDWTHERFLRDVRRRLADISIPSKVADASRPVDDMIQEILQIVKSLPSTQPSTQPFLEPSETANEQYYPTNDRIELYKFLKERVKLPLYRNASMPALFDAAARFVQGIDPSLNDEQSLVVVAKYLISERPLKDLLEGLTRYEKAN